VKEVAYKLYKEHIFVCIKEIGLSAIDKVSISLAKQIKPLFSFYGEDISSLPDENELQVSRSPIYVNLQPQNSDQKIRCEVALLTELSSINGILDVLDCGPEDVDDTPSIPLTVPVNLNGLVTVLEFCKFKRENASDEEIQNWIKNFPQPTLFEIILAANALGFKSLLDLSCQCVANMIKGKSPEQIRQTFGIKNDFTPEEEEKVRRENEWCEER